MDQRDIWEEFMCQSESFIRGTESLEEFKRRMEDQGFFLEYISPGTCQDLSDAAFVAAVIGHLNTSAGTGFRTKLGSANANLILARRKEKYQLQDFLTVIDKKVAAWKGTVYATSLTPETLFSRKHFDNYLGQKIANGQSDQPKTLFDTFTQSLERAKGNL